MSVTTVAMPSQVASKPARRKFTLIPRLDENPKIVAQAQTLSGKIAVLGMAACLLGWRSPRPVVFLIAVALVTFLPAYRRIVLAAAALYWIAISGLLKQELMQQVAARAGIHIPSPAIAQAIWILSGIACVSLAFVTIGHWVRTQGTSIVSRRPVLCLAMVLSVALAMAGTQAMPAAVRISCWILAAPLSGCLWLLAYALRDQRRERSAAGIAPALATLWSSGSSSTPMLKGPAHARHIEAIDAREFAIAQLKGIKLLAWTMILIAISV